MRVLMAIALAGALVACAQTGGSVGPPPPSMPDGPAGAGGSIDLGDWRRAEPRAVESRFQASVARALGAGRLTDAVATLQRNQFTCIPGSGERRGDPPAQTCERRAREGECGHTWQVLLFDRDRNAALDEMRALYDRVCESRGGLLGAPPS